MKLARARNLGEAVRALADATPDSRILAGGTDLVVEIESGRTRPDLVVDVSPCSGLGQIVESGRGGLLIGPGATCTDLVRSDAVARLAPMLAAAAREVGAVQIQNRATIGGNLCTASPAADLVPVLFALDARVHLTSSEAHRSLPVEEFVTGYRTTARAPNELVDTIEIPGRLYGTRCAFRKVGTRRAQSISKVVVALAISPDRRTVRIAAGSVADRTVRLRTLEAGLGTALDRGALEAAIESSLRSDVAPRDDVRSTARYRRAVLGRLLARMIDETTRNTG